MLDLIFLIMFIIIIFRSLHGYYNKKLCKVATIIGIAAAIIGILYSYLVPSANSPEPIFNVLVLGIAIAQRYVAQHFAKLYNDKVAQSQKELDDYIELHSHKRDTGYHMNDEDFDNEEIRFGKGGFKPYDNDDVTIGKK